MTAGTPWAFSDTLARPSLRSSRNTPDLQSAEADFRTAKAEADFAHSAEAVTSAAKAGRSAKADGAKGRGISALH